MGATSFDGEIFEIKSVQRTYDPEVDFNHFKTLVDRTRDNSFDLIDKYPEEFVKVDRKNLTSLRKDLRQKSGLPLLLIYLAQKKGDPITYPLLYIEIPNFKGVTKGVSFVKKTR